MLLSCTSLFVLVIETFKIKKKTLSTKVMRKIGLFCIYCHYSQKSKILVRTTLFIFIYKLVMVFIRDRSIDQNSYLHNFNTIFICKRSLYLHKTAIVFIRQIYAFSSRRKWWILKLDVEAGKSATWRSCNSYATQILSSLPGMFLILTVTKMF